MTRSSAMVAAMKATPGGARHTYAPQSSGMGRISPVQAEAYFQNSYADVYGPFLPRPSSVFTNGAFAPMSPIQPTPLDEAPPGALYPDPRWWQYRTGWNLPTQPGSEGLRLASYDQLYTLANRYSVARQCIELRKEEIRGLSWEITLTSDAAKAYQDDRKAMRDFGERKAEATAFFRQPDPDFWSFGAFMDAVLEEVFVYDALCVIFRPKYGASFGMGGRGLLGSNLDSINLVSGPTIRPLIDLHGGRPRPPAPAYQQFLYGVPRSDYMTMAQGRDIEEGALAGSEVNDFAADIMLYAPFVTRRETPYGFPPVERALLPIISGLQKQEFQLDYFTEGTVPAVYISPGDSNITPTQIGELQNALNALAGDPAYHMKVVVLPPGSKVEPQRPVDLSDSFDYLVMNQVAMAFDIQPQELGIIPDIGATQTGPSASGVRFAGQQARDIKSRKSVKPLLMFLCDIFNYAIQDICGQKDMQFQFEGLVDDEDKQAITQLGVEQIQNGVASIDEIRERLDLPPWGLPETSEPIVMTQNGPIPFSMAPKLLQATLMAGQDQDNNSKQPKPKRGTSATRPNGSHSAPVSDTQTPTATPQHAAASAAVQRPVNGRTGGTASRSPVAGSRKRGEGHSPTQGRLRNKAAASELEALKRHLRKGRQITTWEPVNITNGTLAMIAEDTAKGVLLDTAVERAKSLSDADYSYRSEMLPDEATDCSGWFREEAPSWPGCMNGGSPGLGMVIPVDKAASPIPFSMAPKLLQATLMGPGLGMVIPVDKAASPFPGWEHDLELVSEYTGKIAKAFQDAEEKSSAIRKDAATGKMWVSGNTLRGLISDVTKDVFLGAMTPLWVDAWHLGYTSAAELISAPPSYKNEQLRAFVDTEGQHWLGQVSRTGLANPAARSTVIARTEVARAVNDGVLTCYRDNGISHKHLGVAPDDSCDICADAEDDGIIPLDAPFSSGSLSGPLHPQCRCIPLPAGVDASPPQAVKSLEDSSRVAWLLIRARDEDGKWRYLLQQRDDGTWGMPGGGAHVDEDGIAAAFRETAEEIGDLPPMTVVRNFSHTDPDGKLAYLYLCETSLFTPLLNGSTPEETAGTGWFRRKEIAELDLTPKFRDDWEKEVNLCRALKDLGKVLQRTVDENGQENLFPAQGGGARWPYPHNSGGAEWPDAGPGAVPGSSAGGEPPRHDPDHADSAGAHLYPDGEEEEFPRRRGRTKPASRFPSPETDGEWPEEENSLQPPATGIPKGIHPVIGTVPPKTPLPSTPHPAEPEAFDPAEEAVILTPEGNAVAKGASDYSDPNPVESEHVLNMMRANFPEQSITWVRRASWIGPVDIPWNRINDGEESSWAASHQGAKVSEFARKLKADRNSVHPSVVIQGHDGDKVDIIDGHHRALAHKKLNQPVRAYVGTVRSPADVKAALETHSSQLHQGKDPGNK